MRLKKTDSIKTIGVLREPRYAYAQKTAHQFLLSHNIARLPIDPYGLIEQNGWKLLRYHEFSLITGIPLKEIRKSVKNSNDGGVLYCHKTDEYAILYNEKIYSKGRIRWTLIHEIGHIVLRHHRDYPEQSAKGDPVLEKEADHFAYHVLAPPVVLHALKVVTAEEISKICGLSMEAATNRLTHLQRWRQIGRLDVHALQVLGSFHDYIKQRKCLFCGAHFTSETGRHCSICGETHLVWGDGEMFYNDGFQVNENGKAMICPRCKNEEIYDDDDHDYCQICGTYLINECAATYLETDTGFRHLQQSCGRPVAGNARFCPNCGNVTTFYERGLLEPWDKVQERLLKESTKNDTRLKAVSN